MVHQKVIAIVGAGIAGFTAAKTLVEAAADIDIVLVNGEDRPPYKRTRISKTFAAGFDREGFSLASSDWYIGNGVSLMNGRTASRIDTSTKSLTLDTGEVVHWDALILATGSEAEELLLPRSGGNVVHTVRTASDVERLRDAVQAEEDVYVAGGGVLGVEVSEQLQLLEKRVTLSVAGNRLMPRELNEFAAGHLLTLLEEKGIAVRRNNRTTLFPDAVRSVVACVGTTPDVLLAREAGIAVRSGILVDTHLQTSVPGVFAAGDAAEHPDGAITHLWHAAEYQGQLAARNAAAYVGVANTEQSIFDNPPFRLKCEVFGHYYFSAGIIPGVNADPAGTASSPFDLREDRSNVQYRLFSFKDGRLAGVIMIDDAERAKTYQRAVREQWDLRKVEEELS